MIHFFKSDLGFIYGGKSKTRHEHKIQKSSSLGSISTFWVKPEPQPHLKTSLAISMLQVCRSNIVYTVDAHHTLY